MKKAIFLMGYLSLEFCHLDMANATNAVQQIVPMSIVARGAAQPLDTLLISSGFTSAISKNILAVKILASCVFYIIQKNLNLIHSTHIDSARQCLDKIITSMREAKSEKYNQLKKLSALLNSVLRCKNDILRILRLEKNNIDHGFADFNNPLMADILCMFAYVERDQLHAIAKFLAYMAKDPKAGDYRNTYETVAKKINDLLNDIADIEELIKSLSPTKDDLLESMPAVSAEDKDALLKDLHNLTERAEHMKRLLEKRTS
ncbi:MAG: hypothetical protein LBC04_00570 [Holosporaceae bacterium]|jgi:hypothetical protein|nr:hypothetical protein [Holosporaceae bacterium]